MTLINLRLRITRLLSNYTHYTRLRIPTPRKIPPRMEIFLVNSPAVQKISVSPTRATTTQIERIKSNNKKKEKKKEVGGKEWHDVL